MSTRNSDRLTKPGSPDPGRILRRRIAIGIALAVAALGATVAAMHTEPGLSMLELDGIEPIALPARVPNATGPASVPGAHSMRKKLDDDEVPPEQTPIY